VKRCKKCGQTKPLSDFYREQGCRDGHRPECKACNLAARKVKYQENPAREIARVKAWQQRNPDRVARSQRAYRAEHREELRAGHLRRRFGISPADYEAMLEAQGGGCAVCGRPPREGSSLHVDHDHATGEVRGLLCFRCNGGLGQFGDDPERLRIAMDYLNGCVEPTATRSELDAMAITRARELVSAPG
jgi:hypothetical protein